jgi:hypothetical protein
MLCVVIPSVIMLNAILLGVVAPIWRYLFSCALYNKAQFKGHVVPFEVNQIFELKLLN